MNTTVPTLRTPCGCCTLSRRRFLAGCASCAAGALTVVAPRVPAAEPASRPKVRLVFSHHRQDAQGKQSEAGWPYLGYDHEARKRELLTRLQQACPGVEFLPATAYNPDDARKILQDDAAVDGYVAYMIGGWARGRPNHRRHGPADAVCGRPVRRVRRVSGGLRRLPAGRAESGGRHLVAFRGTLPRRSAASSCSNNPAVPPTRSWPLATPPERRARPRRSSPRARQILWPRWTWADASRSSANRPSWRSAPSGPAWSTPSARCSARRS